MSKEHVPLLVAVRGLEGQAAQPSRSSWPRSTAWRNISIRWMQKIRRGKCCAPSPKPKRLHRGGVGTCGTIVERLRDRDAVALCVCSTRCPSWVKQQPNDNRLCAVNAELVEALESSQTQPTLWVCSSLIPTRWHRKSRKCRQQRVTRAALAGDHQARPPKIRKGRLMLKGVVILHTAATAAIVGTKPNWQLI